MAGYRAAHSDPFFVAVDEDKTKREVCQDLIIADSLDIDVCRRIWDGNDPNEDSRELTVQAFGATADGETFKAEAVHRVYLSDCLLEYYYSASDEEVLEQSYRSLATRERRELAQRLIASHREEFLAHTVAPFFIRLPEVPPTMSERQGVAAGPRIPARTILVTLPSSSSSAATTVTTAPSTLQMTSAATTTTTTTMTATAESAASGSTEESGNIVGWGTQVPFLNCGDVVPPTSTGAPPFPSAGDEDAKLLVQHLESAMGVSVVKCAPEEAAIRVIRAVKALKRQHDHASKSAPKSKASKCDCEFEHCRGGCVPPTRLTTDYFISKYECVLCENVLERGCIWVCENDHPMCSYCRERLDLCVTCRSEFDKAPPKRARFMERQRDTDILPFISKSCDNAGDGCAFVSRWIICRQHELRCPLKKYTCPSEHLPGQRHCDETMVMTALEDHMISNHHVMATRTCATVNRIYCRFVLELQYDGQQELLRQTASFIPVFISHPSLHDVKPVLFVYRSGLGRWLACVRGMCHPGLLEEWLVKITFFSNQLGDEIFTSRVKMIPYDRSNREMDERGHYALATDGQLAQLSRTGKVISGGAESGGALEAQMCISFFRDRKKAEEQPLPCGPNIRWDVDESMRV